MEMEKEIFLLPRGKCLDKDMITITRRKCVSAKLLVYKRENGVAPPISKVWYIVSAQ